MLQRGRRTALQCMKMIKWLKGSVIRGGKASISGVSCSLLSSLPLMLCIKQSLPGRFIIQSNSDTDLINTNGSIQMFCISQVLSQQIPSLCVSMHELQPNYCVGRQTGGSVMRAGPVSPKAQGRTLVVTFIHVLVHLHNVHYWEAAVWCKGGDLWGCEGYSTYFLPVVFLRKEKGP